MLQRYCCVPPFLRILIVAAFWGLSSVGVSASPAPEEAADLRLGDDVVPVFQSIHLTVDADQETYSGSVSIELQVKAPVEVFHFHSEGPELTSLRLSTGGQAVEVEHAALGDDVVEVSSKKPLVLGDYLLEIEFTNPFDTKATSLYRAVVGEHAYTFTQFEATDAREAFPSWDEPRFKFPYQMTLTVPEKHLAVSNMPVESESEADGWRTTVFAKSPPMPSYLLALATGPFEQVDMPGLGVPARILTVQGQIGLTSMAVEVTPSILKAMEAYFGSPYPYRKLDFVAVPEFWPGAMENPGLITYVDRLLVIDPATATIRQRRSQAGVIAHELAHQWFGNLVTMEWWDDLWLNESFADWMGDKITHQLFPELGADINSTMAGQRIMVADARETSVAIRQPITKTEKIMQDLGLAYSKGKNVLAMFERWLGEETFRKGVLDYLKAREWKNATADDLWRALSKASGQPIDQALATFIDQPGVPKISVEDLGEGKVRLSQERFRNHGAKSEDLQWKIPVILRFGAGGSAHTKAVLLDRPSLEVDLGVEGPLQWLHPNGETRGYYRWSVSADALKALTTEGLPHLSAVERINLVTNSSALLQAGEIGGGTFLGVLTQLAQDPEPMVVSSVVGELGLVDVAFVPDSLQEAYGSWIDAAFSPALDRFGKEKQSGEAETVALVRPRLLRLMAREAEDQEVLDYFRKMGETLLKEPSGVDPTLAGLALWAVVKDGDSKMFDEMQKRAESAKTPTLRSRYLSALGAFEDPALQQRAMTYALEGPIRPNEIFNVVGGIGRTEEGQDQLFQFVMDNWDALGEKLPAQFRSFMPGMAGGCSKERLQVAEEFFGRPEHQGPGVERSMERVRETVRDCVALRERESESVSTFLQAYGG